MILSDRDMIDKLEGEFIFSIIEALNARSYSMIILLHSVATDNL